jgi:hypothetical protein
MQDVQVQLLRPPVTIRPRAKRGFSAMRAGKWAFLFVAHDFISLKVDGCYALRIVVNGRFSFQ